MRSVFVLLVLVCAATAADDAVNLMRTNGHFNGRCWVVAPNLSRIAFVAGLTEGMAEGIFTGANISPTSPWKTQLTPAGIDAWDKQIDKLTADNAPGQMTFGEVADSIDKFYAQPENRIMPILTLYKYVSQRVHGISEDVIQQQVIGRRTFYNRSK